MNIVKGLKYSKEHEWLMIEDGKAKVGITNFAQLALGDIVYVELPKIGKEIKQGESMGVVESVKAVSEVYSPLSGKVVEVNEELTNSPDSINQEPYESWIALVEVADQGELNELMDEEQYAKYCIEG